VRPQIRDVRDGGNLMIIGKVIFTDGGQAAWCRS